jgi:hypothetical protein
MMSPIARFLLSIVGSAFYLGLAVLGWGGFGAFFSNPARTALAVVTLLIGVAAFFAGGNLSRGVREDRSNRWVIAALTVIGLLAGYLPALTDRLDFWTIDGDAVRWLGVALYAVGGALRLWPVYVLGNPIGTRRPTHAAYRQSPSFSAESTKSRLTLRPGCAPAMRGVPRGLGSGA